MHGGVTERDVLLDASTPLRSQVRLTGFGLAAPGPTATPAADVRAAGAMLGLLTVGNELPAALAEVAAALLADDPEARPSAAQARDRLRAAAGLEAPVGRGARRGPAVPAAPRRRRGRAVPAGSRRRRGPAVLVAGLAAAAVGLAAVAVAAGQDDAAPQTRPAAAGPPAAPSSEPVPPYSFAPLREGGLVVARTWTLSADGTRLHGDTVVTGPTAGAVDEVLPASVVARAEDVRYDPAPDQLQPGRAARYLMTGGERRWSFDAVLPAPVTTAEGLAALAADTEAARAAYARRLALAASRVLRLSVVVARPSLRVGGTSRVTVTARRADGRVTAPPGLQLTSSDPAVLAVDAGVVRALRPGAARVVARAGGLQATAQVLVAAPPPSPSPSPSPEPEPEPAARAPPEPGPTRRPRPVPYAPPVPDAHAERDGARRPRPPVRPRRRRAPTPSPSPTARPKTPRTSPSPAQAAPA